MKRAVLAFLLCAPAAFGGTATKFIVAAPENAHIGIPFDVTVTAIDDTNATDPTFTGTIHFASSSPGTLPADYAFVSSDNGTHVFSMTLNTRWQQSITVTCGPINGHTYLSLWWPATRLSMRFQEYPTPS